MPLSSPALKVMQADVRWLTVGALLAVLVNLHGVVRLSVMPGLIPGQLNPVLAPMAFACMLLAFVVRSTLRESITLADRRAVLAMSAGSALILLVGLGLMPFSTGAVLQKLARDLAFLGVIVGLTMILGRHRNAAPKDVRAFATGLVLVGGILFPAAGLALFDPSYEGRHGGFLLTPTMMANTTLLTLVIAYRCGVRPLLLVLATSITAVVIIQSGTRAAFLLFTGFLLFVAARPLLRRSTLLVTVGVIAVAGAVAAVGPLLLDSLVALGPDAARVVSTTDLETGSIATRFIWIQALLAALPASYYFGGFGAGQSEAMVGTLPHFDILRFWFDYSLLYPLVLMSILWKTLLGGKRFLDLAPDTRWFVLYLVGSILLMTTHNPFQDVSTTLLIVIACAFATREASRRSAGHTFVVHAVDASGRSTHSTPTCL